jgi:hypothetical protein
MSIFSKNYNLLYRRQWSSGTFSDPLFRICIYLIDPDSDLAFRLNSDLDQDPGF